MKVPTPKAQIASVAFIAWLIPFSIATPFGTINGALHQHAEHEMITRSALRCPDGQKSDGICFEPLSLDNLAGSPGFNGAVGSPDTLPPEDAVAHCDDADFLNIPDYPQSRADASAALQACVDHLRMRFGQGIRGAARMLDSDNKIIDNEVNLKDFGQCGFSHREKTDDMINRGKCVALEGLGRALHGTEDFYSHSNWADQSDPNRPISVTNPPGLNYRTLANDLLDLRASNSISEKVPIDLTTGCFNVAEMLPNGGTGSFGCRNRVIHENLNKDHGVITLDGSITPDANGVPREEVSGNFARAVLSAIQDARERWKNFRDELKRQHDPEKAALIICAMVRDDPAKDCRNRKLAIVVDSSGSNSWTDPSNLRIQAARDFNAKLTTAAQAGSGPYPDQVAVVDFDDSASLLYPMGDPAGAAGTFGVIDSSGGTNIGSGIAMGIDEIIKDQPGFFAKRSGIVVLTDGEDGSPANQLLQLARAKVQGIRVNYGFLSPPVNPVTKRSLQKRDPSPDIISGILSTGGTFGIITSAKAQKNFINLVIARGATEVDSPVGSTLLTSGVTVTENLTPEKNSHDFIYSASAGERLNFTLTVVKGTAGITGVLRNVRANENIATLNATSKAPAKTTFDASVATELELIVSAPGNVSSEIIFSVGMGTNLPDKNVTTTSSVKPTTTSSNYTVSAIANATTTGYFKNATSTFNSKAYPTGPVTEITYVYTTLCTTQVVTTVCDGPDTSIMTIYPVSRVTSVITTTIAQYVTATCPTCSHGYAKATSKPGATPTQPQSGVAYTVQWNKYVSSAYQQLQSGPPPQNTYVHSQGYPPGPPLTKTYVFSQPGGPSTKTYVYSQPGGPSTKTYVYSHPGHAPPSSPPQPGYPGATTVVQGYQAVTSPAPANPPLSTSPYIYYKATTTYEAGNSTTTTGGPMLYTGGAIALTVRDTMSGVVGAVVAVMGFGLL
ncbi:uncharacterized protein BDR25DRAFT_392099 [Lindgomyces ingoldianus]|uniref:Uncharacterized protein n=1 Tax=Lindgomyces ingoldianus TaxID=673940 RepID=A0ACB6R5K5_9PLEO|nr:uncharacterized protein BDR25DRAFT_392099 [Lindgomyces ingoldianus]KAF2474431.1 hypothetical protein BDR25DRAFT_392099 [Lindgomyces ingoldianus]